MLNVPANFAHRTAPPMQQDLATPAPAALRPGDTRAITAVLDLARWAPSGDNTQPWRFEIVDGSHVVVHGFDTRDHCVYDLDGRPSQMSIGALIETAAIAASGQGLRMRSVRRQDAPETRPTFDLRFSTDRLIERDPLHDFITHRSTQRRPFSTTPLTARQKAELESCVGAEHSVRWIEGTSARASMARLLFGSAWLRLVTPEAYRVHHEVIEWNTQFSVDKVPDQSLGVNQAMLNMMRFAMHSWPRVQFFNRFLAGTWLPRIQMDLLPALGCGAHFALLARRPPLTIDDNIAAGRAMQRFWLTATRLGLVLQPEMTPLIFARFSREGRAFSSTPGALEVASQVGNRLAQIMGVDTVECGCFMGRIGSGPAPRARSIRKDLKALLHEVADKV